VLTCSPARNPDSKYQAWGHSSAISPSGQVLATTGHEPSVVFVEIEQTAVETVRAQIPIRRQKRTDLYALPYVLSDGPASASNAMSDK
jgi:omega-amidase